MSAIKAVGKLEDGFRVRVQTGGYEYVLDEPKEMGGTEQGAIPGEVLLAALAGCQAMVARLWFMKSRLTPRGVDVEVVGDGPVNMQTGEIALEFDTLMKVDADLSDEQMAELAAFVEQMCMVATTLKQANPVRCKFERV